jgi:hypothetical protein
LCFHTWLVLGWMALSNWLLRNSCSWRLKTMAYHNPLPTGSWHVTHASKNIDQLEAEEHGLSSSSTNGVVALDSRIWTHWPIRGWGPRSLIFLRHWSIPLNVLNLSKKKKRSIDFRVVRKHFVYVRLWRRWKFAFAIRIKLILRAN